MAGEQLSNLRNLQGRNISLDRYFTSVTLAEWCLERNITIVGTLKSDQKGIPKEMKGVADWEEKSSAFCYSEDEKAMLLSYIYKKKKGKIILALVFYDHTKGGVNVVDLISAKMSTRMKTRRWTLNVFAFMLDTACTNPKTIVKENTPTKPLSTFQFT